ncbi:MAG: divalent-cation tolerance protein CutA [Microthrixaceae bacterium]
MSDVSAVVLVTVSVPDAVTADRIAEALVEQRLAACVKRSGPVRSVYRWQGRVQRDDEWLLSCVTLEHRVEALAVAVRGLHPHEVPEVVATPVLAGDPDYLDWVAAEVDAAG